MALSMSPRTSRVIDLPADASDEELLAWGRSLRETSVDVELREDPGTDFELDLAAAEERRPEFLSIDEVLEEIAQRAQGICDRAAAEAASARGRLHDRLRSLDDALDARRVIIRARPVTARS
jgi:hypothetical protein